ncbi:MAG: cyclodeaminase/cyclohydrolase family protein [Candidatus Omnitrophica bacterium]|nr:cyclodeaminase/cyclohydrolase family protein [Candidatus Omnitrophota bacterium]
MRYSDKSVKHYIDKLAAKTPVPGGGSVAALLGALGCGLLSMVANYTVSGKSYNGYKERAEKALKDSEKLRKQLIELNEKDIEAYERLSRAFKKHKDHVSGLQPSLKSAVIPPLKVCSCVHKAAVVALQLAYVGNKSIIPDICVGMYALDAAFESALVNIGVNLRLITDKRYVVDKSEQSSRLHNDMKKIKTEVLSKTRERMLS